MWWKDLPDYIRKNVAHYYEPCLFTIPKDSSKSMQFAVAVKETISAILFFMRNMGKYLVQYGLFMGFFAFTAKMGRGGGGSGRMFGETGTKDGMGISTQDSLEARPYWDQSQVTFDTFNVTSPFVGKCINTHIYARTNMQDKSGKNCYFMNYNQLVSINLFKYPLYSQVKLYQTKKSLGQKHKEKLINLSSNTMVISDFGKDRYVGNKTNFKKSNDCLFDADLKYFHH